LSFVLSRAVPQRVYEELYRFIPSRESDRQIISSNYEGIEIRARGSWVDGVIGIKLVLC
jgi:hypothetical protein